MGTQESRRRPAADGQASTGRRRARPAAARRRRKIVLVVAGMLALAGAIVAKLGTRGAEVATAYSDLPKIVQASEYDWETGEDPFAGHVAFGVPDIAAARAELDRLEVSYWIVGRAEKQQVFLYDAARKMVELYQIGTCRCGLRARR